MNLKAGVANNSHAIPRKLLKAVMEFHTRIEHNKSFTPNYGER